MTLDGKYFNELELDVVRDKYYDADEVDDILLDIRRKAESQCEELSELKKQLEELNVLKAKLKELEMQKEEIGEAVMAARCAYKSIVEKANAQAKQIISEAEKKVSSEASEESVRDENFYISKAEKMISRIKKSNSVAESEINDEWQRFLSSLADGSESEENDETASDDLSVVDEMVVSEKISKIANEIKGIS